MRKRLISFGCMFALTVTMMGCGTNNNSSTGANSAEVIPVTEEAATPDTTQEAEEEPEVTKESSDADSETAVIDQLAEPEKGETVAVLDIKDYGTIKLHFFKDAAPKAVENFISLAEKGYYDGVTFHRVINDFMIQGGDPNGNGTGGTSIWKEDFEDEINEYLIPLRGSLCMANAGGGNTNGSQFFIVQSGKIDIEDEQQIKDQLDYYISVYKNSTGLTLDSYNESVIKNYLEVGGCLYLSGGYTVFGQVYEGLEVVDAIAATATDSNDKPLKDVIIESIDITTY